MFILLCQFFSQKQLDVEIVSVSELYLSKLRISNASTFKCNIFVLTVDAFVAYSIPEFNAISEKKCIIRKFISQKLRHVKAQQRENEANKLFFSFKVVLEDQI